METLKVVVVLGVLGAVVAIGLAYLLAAVTGGNVTADEMSTESVESPTTP